MADRGYRAAACGALAFGAAAALSGCGDARTVDDRSLQSPATEVGLSYFGCGCFWHVQEAMITGAEIALLGRSDSDFTAFVGYAGGTEDDGRVCYHNAEGAPDYGSLGYAEVVSMQLSEDEVTAVSRFFLSDVCAHGIREDSGDAGTEYRSLVGFPGGLSSPMGRAFRDVAAGMGVDVAPGSGGDADTPGTVYIMDSDDFPFHQAEVYHQFHDDMVASYSGDYHGLRSQFLASGKLRHTGCPSDEVPAISSS